MKDRVQLSIHPPTKDVVELEAQIERVTYTNEETGYTVARANAQGFKEPITIVGNLLTLIPGEMLRVKGVWENHPKFGRQVRVLSHITRLPVSMEGIKKYLGSGIIKGIGPVMADKIVKKFREHTLEVIDERIEALAGISGIGRKRVAMIRKAWADQKGIRTIMIFLQEHGIGLGYAIKIYKQYGQRSVAVVTQNPYRLATEISGMGFKTADKIAQDLGFKKDAPVRAEAGILYVLNQLSGEGHIFYPYDQLVERSREILDVDRETIMKGFGSIALDEKIVIEDLNKSLDDFEPNYKAVYLKRLFTGETGIAVHLQRLLSSEKSTRSIDGDKAIMWVQKRFHLKLAQEQIHAVERAISDKVLVITGGPGTGKTTIVHAIIQIYKAIGAKILLAAPTGRASKRMSEVTGHVAATIHRMLDFSWQKGGFQRNENHPVEGDVIIVDEASMIDNNLMYYLLKAIPSGSTLILVGDRNQLPSVGPGNVLGDVIKSGVVPVIVLEEVFRQARKSLIVVNAHRINHGMLPELDDKEGKSTDFYFIEQEEPEKALQIILELVSNRVPGRFKVDAKKDIQVLTPMHKGILGTENLNKCLQTLLNPSNPEIVRMGRAFRVNDKVMQIRNNYEKEVFNGDIGIVETIDDEDQEVMVRFDNRTVSYDYMELDEIVLAYAISVHKSQGSEYPAVILPIVTEHYVLLQRNLIYTAVTRGKRLVIMVGSKKAFAIGVRNETGLRRYTFLGERLRNISKSYGDHFNG